MKSVRPKRLLVSALILCLPLILSGCFLRSVFGNVIYVETTSEFVDAVLATVFSDGDAAVCQYNDSEFIYECTYIIDGLQHTSTFYLVSELGFAGVLIDPLILQIPADAARIQASYDNGGGPQPLPGSVRNSFETEPGNRVTAEPGTRFLILEFPEEHASELPDDPNNGSPFSFSVQFEREVIAGQPVPPTTIKAILTAKVIVNEHEYFIPTLPCTADFASLPAITIPQSETPVSLQTEIGSHLNQNPSPACNREVYNFASAPPPYDDWLYLPLAVR